MVDFKVKFFQKNLRE